MDAHQLHLPCDVERALAAVAQAAGVAGARWQGRADGGTLELPVSAGVRQGMASGELSVVAAAEGCELVFAVHSCSYRIRRMVLALLVLAAAGALLVVVAPFLAYFQPRLLALVPLAVVLAVGGWFLVATQLRPAGPDDFLRLVAEMAAEPAAEGSP